MDENETFRAVCKEIFGQDIGLSLEEGEKVFAQGILLPPKRKTISGETVYTNYDAGKYVDFKNIEMSIREDTLMRKTAEIKSLEDLERFYRQVDTFLANKTINSKDCRMSDSVLGSMNVYHSLQVRSCKFVGFSQELQGCEYTYGSKSMADSSFCIRCQDSKLVNNCFEVSWSGKCSNCLYCHDCFDLRDCMFCFHIVSKQYCIANRQYTKEEYFRIKKKVVAHLLKNKFKMNFFPVL